MTSRVDGQPKQESGQGQQSARRQRSKRALNEPRSLEDYLRASSPPRYMRRLREIENEFRAHRRRLEAAYQGLIEACGHDLDAFARRWRAQASAWSFARLNELVREHNLWYPVEVRLPMDPRTRDYRPVRGASYRRLELGSQWVLEHFPPTPRGGDERPELPARAPRAPL